MTVDDIAATQPGRQDHERPPLLTKEDFRDYFMEVIYNNSCHNHPINITSHDIIEGLFLATKYNYGEKDAARLIGDAWFAVKRNYLELPYSIH